MRRMFLFVVMTASILSAQVKVTPQAKAIHDSAIVVDTHADTTQFFLDPNFDLDTPPIDMHLDLEKAKRGDLSAKWFTKWIEPTIDAGKYAHRTLQLVDGVYEQARKHPGKMRMALS